MPDSEQFFSRDGFPYFPPLLLTLTFSGKRVNVQLQLFQLECTSTVQFQESFNYFQLEHLLDSESEFVALLRLEVSHVTHQISSTLTWLSMVADPPCASFITRQKTLICNHSLPLHHRKFGTNEAISKFFLFSRSGRIQGLLYKQRCYKIAD